MKTFAKIAIAALLIVLVVMVAGGLVGWSYLGKEHREAANLSLDAVDFSRLNDGVYHGAYDGGMYGWRKSECDVTVADGRVTEIKLTGSADPGCANAPPDTLFKRVIKAQSLQVDAVSSATLTSKAYLKSVENALVKAQKSAADAADAVR